MIGLDAFSSRGLQKASTPAMNEMIAYGALALHARCVVPTVSTPNWTAMLTGADPLQTGVQDNSWKRDNRNWEPVITGREDVYPSILSWIKDQKPKARMHFFYEWDDLSRMFEMSLVDKEYQSDSGEDVFDKAVESFFADKPEFLFISIDETDAAGHKYGHDTEDYYASLSKYDKKIGDFIARLKSEGLMDETFIMVTGDHGGIDFGHGGTTLHELEIPIICYGKGVSKGTIISKPCYIYDVAPTLAWAMGVEAPGAGIGRIMHEVFRPATESPAYVPMPKVLPAAGTYPADPLEITMDADGLEVNIYYTLDGTNPDAGSTLYTGPFKLSTGATVRAVSVYNGQLSREEQVQYRILGGSLPMVHWKYFEGKFEKVPDFAALKPIKTGKSEEISLLELPHREDHFAVLFTTGLKIEKAGKYTFYTKSDDGSVLWINGVKVVDNDGSHGVRIRKGTIELNSGLHQLEVGYFEDYMGELIEVWMEGPGIHKQILTSAFFHQ
ncbi:MAG: alkaline phosphatase family protein [Cyclobacteriaceae bacterium]|nr:alkaline phosphatase family protein [Cyclobacteriaceae bacterium]